MITGNTNGGVVNVGTANLTGSTVSGNSAHDGAGIRNGQLDPFFDGTMSLTNCTVTGNFTTDPTSGVGGGILNLVGDINVSNSTISNNSGSTGGGGIWNIQPDQGIVQVKSSIIAQNAGGDVGGVFSSQGFNLVGNTDGGFGFTAPTDQTGTGVLPLDPKLDPNGLQDNGGPTLTIALLPDSPAIDQGTSDSLIGNLTTDQRGDGFPRTIDYAGIPNAAGGDGTDAGAFELAVQELSVFSAVSRKTHGTAGQFDISLPLTGTAGVECRSGGDTGVHQIIVTFFSPVTVASVTATPDPNAPGATGSISDFSVNGAEVTINLTNVSNAQTILITLSGVSDGANTIDVNVPMGVLVGDTTGNGSVKSDDFQLVQSKFHQPVDTSNFREDITVDGAINRNDSHLVRLAKDTSLP
jgi:hypothetical protein